MLLTPFLLLAQISGLLAAPTSNGPISGLVNIKRSSSLSLPLDYAIADPSIVRRREAKSYNKRAGTTAPAASVAAANASTADSCAAPPPVAAAAVGEVGAAEQELELNATFGQAVALGGGDIKTDIFYPPSAIGFFEVEFQNPDPRTLTVTENKSPASPPAGFVAVEPSSFIINIAEGGSGLTLSKVDYFFDVTNPAVAALNLAQTQVGKLSANGCSFVIDPALGELEFEADENELTLKVADINGEWGIFIPQAGAVAAAATGEATEEEVLVNGTFGTPTAVTGGNVKTDILFPGNVKAAGAFEVEYNGTAANAITVRQNANRASPPTGFLFVDPTTFQVTTAAATNPATDTVKIDYFYSEQVKALADVSQGVIGKLDPTTNTFITSGLGEFEVELEENEWTLTVEDLNGEWAMLIPRAALL